MYLFVTDLIETLLLPQKEMTNCVVSLKMIVKYYDSFVFGTTVIPCLESFVNLYEYFKLKSCMYILKISLQVLHYYLVDDCVEVREVQKPNNGRDPFPILLRKQRLPKSFHELSGIKFDCNDAIYKKKMKPLIY